MLLDCPLGRLTGADVWRNPPLAAPLSTHGYLPAHISVVLLTRDGVPRACAHGDWVEASQTVGWLLH